MTRRLIYSPLFFALIILFASPLSAGAQEDATALFRDEIIDAPARLKVRESSLSDETRFAAAASGLSWRPAWNGLPLLVQQGKKLAYGDGVVRLNAFNEAHSDGANKIAFAFALSVVLHPPDYDAAGWRAAYDHLKRYPADFDKALIGVLAAPERLPLLYDYRHAAADALIYRASPRLLPLFLGLAGSDDRYLRSRAVAGLGIIGYRTGPGLAPNVPGLLVAPKELGISAVQTAMIYETVQRASEDGDYRVRAAAALALGLLGDDEGRALLMKLGKDRAYLKLPRAEQPNTVSVSYPVRAQAARALERWSARIDEGGGVYNAKLVSRATRGGKDVTNETREAAKKVAHRVRFNEGEW